MLKFAETALEDIQLRTSLVRLLLAGESNGFRKKRANVRRTDVSSVDPLSFPACSYSQACDETFLATSRAGYDIHQIPSELLDLVPKSPEEVRHLSSLFDASETPPSEALSVKLAVLAILGEVSAFDGPDPGPDKKLNPLPIVPFSFRWFVFPLGLSFLLAGSSVKLTILKTKGPTIYVSQTPTTRAAAYTLAIAILCSSSTTLRSDPSSYLVGVYSLTSVEDVQLKFSFSELALRIVNLRPGSYFESPGTSSLSFLTFLPLVEIRAHSFPSLPQV